MKKPVFFFEDLTVRSFDKIVFEHLNFTFEAGQQWAIVGKSGSGKTTLLNAIAGRASFPAGIARYPLLEEYAEKRIPADPLYNKLRLISYISARHQFRNLSHTTDFYYQQRFNSMDSEDSETVRRYLQSVCVNTEGYWSLPVTVKSLRLSALLDKELIKLSNGETKRLMIAAALMRNPMLLLMDNPLTGLDAGSRQEFNELLKDIAASGISMVMTVPEDEIPDVITNIARISDGRLDTMRAEEYHAAAAAALSDKTVDKKLLAELMTGEMPPYDLIVGMEEVTIRYGEKLILDKISWEVKQGERWMLTGENGAGKSTLLSLINGDNPQAFANRIVLFDKPKGAGESIWEIKKRIGFVSPELFQYFPMDNSCIQVAESGFYDTMGLFRRSEQIKSAVCLKWMRLFNIGQYAAVPFKNVPIGVQRLCLLVRALVKQPVLLILDEPCQGLDPVQQDHFRQLIDEICKLSRMSVIYVSHYAKERPNCVTRNITLSAGRRIE